MFRGDRMMRETPGAPRRFEARLAGRPNGVGPSGEQVSGRDVADRTVQAAINCGPLSEIMRGHASGNFSRARCKIVVTSCVVIDSRSSQCTR